MIVVVGAGPAGIAAALRASECGARVQVIDDNAAAGGQIWRGERAHSWVKRFRVSGISTLHEARVISVDAGAHTLLVETAAEAREIAWDKLILATGSREIFLPFPGWTLPGVFGAGGLQAFGKGGLSVAGKRIVVGGSGPLLLAVAAWLRSRGARVKLIAEQAPPRALAGLGKELLRSPAKLLQGLALQAALAGVPYFTECRVEAAEGSARLERVTLRRGRQTWSEDCDYAAIGYGLIPNDELALSVVRGGHAPPDIYTPASGAAELSLVEGEIAGFSAAGQGERAAALYLKRDKARRFAAALGKAFALQDELKSLPQPDTVVCRCEHVAWAAVRDFTTARAAKLHTRCGMGPCQGRICGPACEFLLGWRREPSVRPPVFPARLGSLLPVTKEAPR